MTLRVHARTAGKKIHREIPLSEEAVAGMKAFIASAVGLSVPEADGREFNVQLYLPVGEDSGKGMVLIDMAEDSDPDSIPF